MFESEIFEIISPEIFSKGVEILLSDEHRMESYQAMYLYAHAGGDEYSDSNCYTCFISSKDQNLFSLNIQLNYYDRHHTIDTEISIEDIISCVRCSEYCENPTLFVKARWMEQFESRQHSIFAIVDACDMKNAIRAGKVCQTSLNNFRKRIDESSERNSQIGYISFADSVILKSDWRMSKYSKYNPELIISVVGEIRDAFVECFSVSAYSVLTQGMNEFQEPDIFWRSKSGNHVCMNSFGTPFAQLNEIESIAKESIRNNTHKKYDFYLSETIFRSLAFRVVHNHETTESFKYESKMSKKFERYFCLDWNDINLDVAYTTPNHTVYKAP